MLLMKKSKKRRCDLRILFPWHFGHVIDMADSSSEPRDDEAKIQTRFAPQERNKKASLHVRFKATGDTNMMRVSERIRNSAA